MSFAYVACTLNMAYALVLAVHSERADNATLQERGYPPQSVPSFLY
jgi:hypothetical protein